VTHILANKSAQTVADKYNRSFILESLEMNEIKDGDIYCVIALPK
jgi:hypothetical protein